MDEPSKTKMVKQLRGVATRANDLANEIHTSEVDETARAIATEAINAFSSIAGIEGGFTLSANAIDEPVTELGLKTRTCRVLDKAGITTLSMLWFRLIQGRLMDIEYFGKKSYDEVVLVLVNSGRIMRRTIET